jgi:sulfite exporter TauE/SafE
MAACRCFAKMPTLMISFAQLKVNTKRSSVEGAMLAFALVEGTMLAAFRQDGRKELALEG